MGKIILRKYAQFLSARHFFCRLGIFSLKNIQISFGSFTSSGSTFLKNETILELLKFKIVIVGTLKPKKQRRAPPRKIKKEGRDVHTINRKLQNPTKL